MRTSIIFETKAITPPGSPISWDLPYLNLVVSGNTELSPQDLLKALKEIEKSLGRDLSAPRWAPRVIDLDILAWGNAIVAEDTLNIPHLEFMNRPFWIHLMASLQPDWRHPRNGLTLTEIVHRLSPQSGALRCLSTSVQLMGIVNITPDSFSDGGKYIQPEAALQRIQDLAAEGAAVIDLGAQSTRPGASPLTAKEEWQRLEPVLRLLRREFEYRPASPLISLDSYHPAVIEQAFHEYPIDWINDVSGGSDPNVLEIVARHSCNIVLTHSLTVPASKGDVLPFEKAPMSYCLEWAEQKISALQAFGIAKEKIIFDPGVGFGKTPLQSAALLHAARALKRTGCEVLVGHSRKSFLDFLAAASERDSETVGVSHFLAKQGVDYLRVHHVAAHQKSLAAAEFLEQMHAYQNI